MIPVQSGMQARLHTSACWEQRRHKDFASLVFGTVHEPGKSAGWPVLSSCREELGPMVRWFLLWLLM